MVFSAGCQRAVGCGQLDVCHTVMGAAEGKGFNLVIHGQCPEAKVFQCVPHCINTHILQHLYGRNIQGIGNGFPDRGLTVIFATGIAHSGPV